MKFTISKTEIVKALSPTLGVVEKRHAMPMLSNILISVEENHISFTATDLESQVRTVCLTAGVESTGKTAVSARKLSDLCRLLPDGSDILIYLDGHKLLIESGSGKYSIASYPSEDFPVFSKTGENSEFKILASTLRGMIKKTSFSMDSQNWRHYLNGMFISVEEKTITLTASDGHRLATCSNEVVDDTSKHLSGIIPRKAINEIGKLLTDLSDEVIISLGSNTIALETTNTAFVSKLIDGSDKVNYQRAIPVGEASTLKVNTKQLSEIISRVSVLSGDRVKGIKLDIGADTVLVSSNNPEQEVGEESFKAEFVGDDLEIAFSVNYIQEMLSNIDSEYCIFNIYSSDKSCLVTSTSDSELKYVIAPLLL